jgi:hypothetical protein
MHKPLIILFCSLFLGLCCHGQEARIITLKQQKPSYIPRSFYIAAIKDVRDDTTSVGMLRSGFSNRKTNVNLSYGVSAALTVWLDKSLKKDTSVLPVEVHIIEFALSENPIAGNQQEVILSLGVSFHKDGMELVSFTGSSTVGGSQDMVLPVEKLIRETVSDALRRFDDWVKKNKDLMAPPGVKLAVVFEPSDDPDNINYSSVPLTWQDFQGRPDDLSRGAAATYGGIGLGYSAIQKGTLTEITVRLSAVFNKHNSWVKDDSRKDYILQHEQRHFDITAIIACRLAAALKTATISQKYYVAEINALHRQYLKIAEEMQAQYDDETEHGVNKKAQAQWELELEESLKQTECYK